MNATTTGRKMGDYAPGSMSWRVNRLEPGESMLVLEETLSTGTMCRNAVSTVMKVKPKAKYAVRAFVGYSVADEEDTLRFYKIERLK